MLRLICIMLVSALVMSGTAFAAGKTGKANSLEVKKIIQQMFVDKTLDEKCINDSGKNNPIDVSKIPLNPKVTVYEIMGNPPCNAGNHVRQLWIYLNQNGKYQNVLETSIGWGDKVTILSEKQPHRCIGWVGGDFTPGFVSVGASRLSTEG